MTLFLLVRIYGCPIASEFGTVAINVKSMNIIHLWHLRCMPNNLPFTFCNITGILRILRMIYDCLMCAVNKKHFSVSGKPLITSKTVL